MEVLIVGAGAMGRWFANTIDTPVAFADTNPAAANTAAKAVDGRVVALETTEQFDAVVIAVPMRVVETAIAEHADKATMAVLDLAGIMTGPVDALERHVPDRERMSLHPLFAPENAPGRIAVVQAAPGPVTEALTDALEAEGNTVFETTPQEHDAAMETVQARTHAAILAFALAADEPVPDQFGTPIYERLVALATEITDGTPRVYTDIQATFDGATAVADAARAIAEADSKEFEQLFRDAGQ